MILGVKAAPSDVDAMRRMPHASFVETVLFGHHVTAEAFEETVAAYEGLEGTVVHLPFTTPEGYDVDPAADDEKVRAAAWDTWVRTMELAERLEARWVVLHPGAIVTPETAVRDDVGARRARALGRITEALERLGGSWPMDRVLMENMPTEGHFADHEREACFLASTAPLDLLSWGDLVGGFTLDISHACLTPGGMQTVRAFLSRCGSQTRHLHVSDAARPRGEGLPIGTGEVDWDRVVRALADLDAARDGRLTAVPEIMGGHLDGAERFRTALAWMQEHLVQKAAP